MEERQITIDGKTYGMDYPYFVMATQNPIEQEGTYRLPEAQLDRFLFKISVTYPSMAEEVTILQGHQQRKDVQPLDNVTPVLTPEEVKKYRDLIHQIHVENKLLEYIAGIVNETRNMPDIYLGASPRASIAILRSSKAFAAIQGRDFVTPEDVKAMALPVMRHRIILSPEKEMEGFSPDEVIKLAIDRVEVPR